MVTRLSGGLTPANGADPRTFPAIWNATAVDIETAESEIDVLQSDIDVLQSETDVLQAGVVSLGTSTGGTASLDFTSGEVLLSHQVSGAAVTIAASGYQPGSTRTLRLLGGTAVASVTTPSDWVFVGGAAGTSIGTATTVIVTATSFGTAASNVVAAYARVQ
jgi:hypothetical protein